MRRTQSEGQPTPQPMGLRELRQVRGISQEQLADQLGQRQPGISKIEQRSDVHLSTLRRYVEGLGGRLEIVARFPKGDVRISQFDGPADAQTEAARRARWVATWKEAGPALEAQKRRELERQETPVALAQLAAAVAHALEHAPMRTTSGLVEQQRRFRRLAR